MIRFFLLLSFLNVTHLLTGQVTGHVEEETGEALAFVNVLLMQASDSSFVKGTTTDLTGHFEIEAVASGDYLLCLRLIGYQNWYSSPFAIRATGEKKTFPGLTLKTSITELEGVEVRAKRMLFEQSMEGMTINVQNSLMSRGSSALQILERSPGVVIDQQNGNFSLNGQSGTLIMINGKRLRMSEAEIVNVLQSMSADNIEKVEILTNPSAKYDAEGTAGIINIVLKKNKKQGTNGSISLTAGYGWGQKEALSFNLNHRQRNINYYGSYSFSNDDTFWNFGGLGDNYLPLLGGYTIARFFNEVDQVNRAHNLVFGIDAEVSKKLNIGANVNMNFAKNKIENTNTNTSHRVAADSLLHTHVKVLGDGRWDNLTSSVFLEKQFKQDGKLNLSLDYLFYSNNNPNEAETTFFDKNNQVIYPEGNIYANEHRGQSNTSIHVGVLKFDVEKQLAKDWQIELGGKVSYSKTKNIGTIERKEGENWITDNRNQSELTIDETIAASYASLHYAINSSTNMTLGARYEYWDRKFSEEELSRSFGRFFPSLFLSKKISDDQRWNLAYNKRITRPNYNDLASFLIYNGPTSVFTGNPLLKPTISNNLKLSYQFRANSFSLSFTNEKNPIARYQIVENEQSDLIIVAPQNVSYQNSIALQMNIPKELKPWWTMNAGGSLAWRKFELSHTIHAAKKAYVAYNLYGSQTFKLPADFSIELSGWYTSGHYNGSIRLEGFGMLNAGIKKALKNGSLQFTVTDVLKSMNIISYYGDLTEEAFKVQSRVHFQAESTNARIFKISYFRTFGNTKLKGRKQRKAGAEEEQSRIQKD